MIIDIISIRRECIGYKDIRLIDDHFDCKLITNGTSVCICYRQRISNCLIRVFGETMVTPNSVPPATVNP